MAPQIVISETAGAFTACTHGQHTPAFNAEACRYFTPAQVREKYPPFQGECSSCHRRVTIWASLAHMQALGV